MLEAKGEFGPNIFWPFHFAWYCSIDFTIDTDKYGWSVSDLFTPSCPNKPAFVSLPLLQYVTSHIVLTHRSLEVLPCFVCCNQRLTPRKPCTLTVTTDEGLFLSLLLVISKVELFIFDPMQNIFQTWDFYLMTQATKSHQRKSWRGAGGEPAACVLVRRNHAQCVVNEIQGTETRSHSAERTWTPV